MSVYGVTWGEVKARCRQEITATRLPIVDVDAVVYSALMSIVSLHNRLGSPIFTRWNGVAYTPEYIAFDSLSITKPFWGITLPSDADQALDTPVYRVYGTNNEIFHLTTLNDMMHREQMLERWLLALDDDDYILTYSDAVLISRDSFLENVFAVVGNVLYLFKSDLPEEIPTFTYMYFYQIPFPSSDATVLRFPTTLLPHLALEFKSQYLARYGQVLNFQSQTMLETYRRAIRTGD